MSDAHFWILIAAIVFSGVLASSSSTSRSDIARGVEEALRKAKINGYLK